MIKENMELVRDEFVFQGSCYESVDSEKKGVLRTIKGPVAEWDNLNRNKRKYTEKLWDKVLDSDYVREQTENKTLYGEANHPENRFDVDFSRVSHNITRMYKVPDKKQVFAEIDILDTPLGNVLNVLYDYGSVIGYSSRAGGVLHNRKNYVEVDEDSYHFVTFDAVPYPSVMSARPLNEGVEGEEELPKADISEEAHNKLLQIIEESGKKDKEVLKDFIYSLRDYNLDKELSVLEGLDIEEDSNNSLKDATLCLLKESYKQIHSLKTNNADMEKRLKDSEKLNIDLTSKLEATLTKVTEISERTTVSNDEVEALKENAQALQNNFEEVSEKNNILLNTIRDYEDSIDEMELKMLDTDVLRNDIEHKNKVLESLNSEKISLKAKLEDMIVENTTLKNQVESLSKFSDYEEVTTELGQAVKEITALKESYTHCVEDLNSKKEELGTVRDRLNEATIQLEDVVSEKTRLEEIIESYQSEVSKSESKVENLYTTVSELNETVTTMESSLNSYKLDLVKAICSTYQVNPNEVVNRLNENFTASNIHLVCDSLIHENSIDIVSVAEEVIEEIPQSTEKTNPKTARLQGMFTSSRRGKI